MSVEAIDMTAAGNATDGIIASPPTDARSDAVAPARTRRSAWSFLSSILLNVVTMLFAMLATPLILRWLGQERLGAYRAASDWFGYTALLDLGLGGSIAAALSRALSRRDEEGVQRTFAAGVRGYLPLTLIAVLGGAVLALVMPRLVPVSPEMTRDLRIGCCIAVVIAMLMPLAPMRLLAEADQRSYLVNLLLVGQSLLITCGAVLLAWRGMGISGQFAATIIGGAFFWICLGLYTHRAHRGLISGLIPRGVEREALADVRAQQWSILALRVAAQVGWFTDNIIIAFFLGPAAVVPFVLTQRLAVIAQGQLFAVSGATWAAMAELYGSGQRKLLSERLIELTQLTMVLGTACLVPIAVFNGRFVSLWVGGDQFAGQVVTTLAVTNAMLMAVVQLWGALFNGTGNASRMVVVATVGATLNLLISVLLTRFGLGLAGPLVGTLAVFLLIHSWAVPRLLRRHFDVDVTHLIWAVARPLIVAAPYALLLWLVGRHLPPLGWISLAAAMAVAAAGQLALSWIFVFPSSQRRMWIGRVRHVIGR